jgi:hypothetical protein
LRRVRWEEYSVLEERVWICGAPRSSLKMKVLGAEVARMMRSAAARGEEADLVSAKKGWRCQHEVRVASINGRYLQRVQSFCLLHLEVMLWRLPALLIHCLMKTSSA